MTPKSIGQMLAYHEAQVETVTFLAALAEDQGDDEKAAAHLATREQHQQWADELRELGTTLVDNIDALTRPMLMRPLFAARPLNDNHARHA